MRAGARRVWLLAAVASSNACLLVEPLEPVNDDAGAGGEAMGGSAAAAAKGGSAGGGAGTGGARGGTAGKGGSDPARGGSDPTTGSSAGRGGSSGNGGTGNEGGSGAQGGTGGGSGGSGGSGTGGSIVMNPGGYVTAGKWGGYAWIGGAGATFENDVEGVEDGDPLCVSGSLDADVSFGGYAMLGVNLNQAPDSTQLNSVVPEQIGVTVDVTNPGGSLLRLELVSDDGKTIWCVPVDEDGSFFHPWNSFVENCWSAGGKPYAREPLHAIGLSVPSATSCATPFDFCLNSFKETTTGPAVTNLAKCTPDCDAGLIDDFEGRIGLIYAQQGRAGAWYTYDDLSGSAQTLVQHASPGDGGGHFIHAWGGPFTVWGAGLGANLNQPEGALVKKAYDASAYAGFRFTYKSASLMRVVVHTLATIGASDPYAEGGTCAGASDECLGFTAQTNGGDTGYEFVAQSSWTTVDVPFASLVQPSWSPDPNLAFEPSTMVSIAFESPSGVALDLSVDDLTFY